LQNRARAHACPTSISTSPEFTRQDRMFCDDALDRRRFGCGAPRWCARQRCRGVNWQPRAGWPKQVQDSVAVGSKDIERVFARSLHEGRLKSLSSESSSISLAANDLIVADTGYMAAWAVTCCNRRAGRNSLRAAGSLGWAFLPLVGAKLEVGATRRGFRTYRRRRIGYHIADLEPAIRIRPSDSDRPANNCSLASSILCKNMCTKHMCPERVNFRRAIWRRGPSIWRSGERVTSPEQFILPLRARKKSGSGGRGL